MRFSFVITVLLSCSIPTVAAQDDADNDPVFGHSAHGSSFDEGPRQRPWKMDGIGTSHFPITAAVPEVQEWFDQGNTLLHSFWYFEAERSFRWCLKLDPDCAMAYWGLARAMGGGNQSERRRFFLKEAVRRKSSVTKRERMYIEAWEKAYLPENFGDVDESDGNPRYEIQFGGEVDGVIDPARLCSRSWLGI